MVRVGDRRLPQLLLLDLQLELLQLFPHRLVALELDHNLVCALEHIRLPQLNLLQLVGELDLTHREAR